MDKRDRILLVKIINEINFLNTTLLSFNFEMFNKNEEKKRATCMTLINIGEKVKLLSNEFKSNNSSIPWKQIAGLRDVTAHGYDTLRIDIILETITDRLPKVKILIEEILNRCN